MSGIPASEGGKPEAELSLSGLQLVLEHVFIPLLEEGSGSDHAKATRHDTSHTTTLLRSLQKFTSIVRHAGEQFSGDTRLTIPELPSESVNILVANEQLISRLEVCMSEWASVMQSLLQQEAHRQILGKGPLAEMDFWQARHEVLGGLYEPLDMPQARSIVLLLKNQSTDKNLLAFFHTQYSELVQMTEEAHDNYKFLRTVERHFRTIATGAIHEIAGVLIPMFNALRLVWAISTYYSDDTRMGLLLQRIAHDIADRAETSINMQGLFRMPHDKAVTQLSTAKRMLERWFTAYMETREKIETSGRESRWEFSKTALFEHTSHMAQMCSSLLSMLDTIYTLNEFLGPQLEAVTGNSHGIKQLRAGVESMIRLVEAAGSNIFHKANSERWEDVCAEFNATNAAIVAATGDLIDVNFSKLRSAEAALDFMARLKQLGSGGALHQKVLSKSTDILLQAGKEIDGIAEIFRENQAFPLLAWNEPPVAGSIRWSRSLFARCKRTWTRLKLQEPEALLGPAGLEVEGKYLALAREMMAFERQASQKWLDTANEAAKEYMKMPVLIEDVSQNKIVVNFSYELTLLMREAKALDRLGFAIPESALHAVLDEQTQIERALLTSHLEVLHKTLEPGLSVLNWHSLTMQDFVGSVRKALAAFKATWSIVRKNGMSLEKVLANIAHAAVFVDPGQGTSEDTMDLNDFVDCMEAHCNEVMLRLSYPDVVMEPSSADIKKALARLASCIVEGTKSFVRWMDGTCLEAQPIPGVGEDEEPFVHSFYIDICQNPELRKSLTGLTQAAQTVLVALHQYCESWKRHQSLWKSDKTAALDKFQAKQPPCEVWEQRMAHYADVAEELGMLQRNVEIGFVSVSVSTLASAIREEALAWLRALWQCMRATDKAGLEGMLSTIRPLRAALQTTTDALDIDRAVRSEALASIVSTGMQWDLDCCDIEERFRTRIAFAALLDVSLDDIKSEYMEACSVRALWRSLEADARALRDVKDHEVVESNKANLAALEEHTDGSED
ncbi:probable Dynein-1-alpha heavy chain, flagellar inner arm I1 complex [Coccomyxa sp. Obi]|nr:probable Dynein-1-alpha heavy chain, flagellar inner arm I1 complex [Coccomyxa sp. Obi]